jgi:hypothetical protein
MMKVTLVKVVPGEDDLWVAHVLLDGEAAELDFRFSEHSVGLGMRIADQHRLLYARFEGTREHKEVQSLVRAVRAGDRLELPMVVHPADRWNFWPPAE